MNNMSDKKLPIDVKKPCEEVDISWSGDSKYEDIIRIIEDGYYEVDLSGTFIFVNDSLCKIFGYHKNRLLGANINDFADQTNNVKGFNAFKEVYETRISKKELDWEIISGNGKKM
jgi:PAS domain S-box-containing protein